MRAGRSELVFFTKTVLQDKLSLKQLVTSREMLTLKNFVLELGENPEIEELGKLAVLAGVQEFPVRVKCASLAWHTMMNALEGRQEKVTTE